MTVGQIKLRIANLFGKSLAACTVNGEDLLASAMNESKTFAEQTIDFEKSKKLAMVTISAPTGVNLSTAVDFADGTTPVKVKSIVNVSVLSEDGNSMVPINFRQRDAVIGEMKADRMQEPLYWSDLRYKPEGYEYFPYRGIREVVQWGDIIMLSPNMCPDSGSVTLILECYTYLPDYGPTQVGPNLNDSVTDFLTTYCPNYLIWQSVVHTNHYFKEFVWRQEGNLPPPEKLAQQYYQAMATWNDYLVAGNTDVYAG